MGCGCKARQDALNQIRPGLGDAVKAAIDSILRRLGVSGNGTE